MVMWNLNDLIWQCCDCGAENIPYNSSSCPACWHGRCNTQCMITKVAAQGASTGTWTRPGKQNSARTRNRRRTQEPGRKVLPITFVDGMNRDIMARYDTGTYENHMSLSLVKSMGYKVDESIKKTFQLPNQEMVHAVGQVTAKIRFSQEISTTPNELQVCYFNVFPTLAVPVLIGMEFLVATETLDKHKHRLKTVLGRSSGPHKICSVGMATNRICCMIDRRLVFAHADTGSDLALVDSRYVERHGLVTLPSREKLMFADGSVGFTQGVVDVLITLPNEGRHGRTPWKGVRFHVLETCSFDFIFGEELVEDYHIFRGSATSLELYTQNHVPTLSPIIHLGQGEKTITKTKERAQRLVRSMMPSKPTTKLIHNPIEQQIPISLNGKKFELLANMAQLDQEENRHRYWASMQSFDVAAAANEQNRQRRYEELRDKLEAEYLSLSNNAAESPGQTLPLTASGPATAPAPNTFIGPAGSAIA